MFDEDSLMASEGSLYNQNNRGYTNNTDNETAIIQEIIRIMKKVVRTKCIHSTRKLQGTCRLI